MTDTTPAVDMTAAEAKIDRPEIGEHTRYNALTQVIRNRVTVRKFDRSWLVLDGVG